MIIFLSVFGSRREIFPSAHYIRHQKNQNLTGKKRKFFLFGQYFKLQFSGEGHEGHEGLCP